MTTHTPKTKTVYPFLEPTFVENIVIRPTGHLLLTTFREGSVYSLEPDATSPEPQLVAKMSGTTALTRIVQIERDTYAVTGGIEAGPMKVKKENGAGGLWKYSSDDLIDAGYLAKGLYALPERSLRRCFMLGPRLMLTRILHAAYNAHATFHAGDQRSANPAIK